MPLKTGLFEGVAPRVRGHLRRGEWLPAEGDRLAAEAVLGRLTAALPGAARARETEARQVARRLQRGLRTLIHHVEDRPVTPLMAEVLTGIAQCLVPWYVSPNPPPAAAAPSYGRSAWVTGDMEEERRMAALGEALRPHLVSLLQDIARPIPPEARPRTPSAAPWSLRHEGRLVRHRREPGVWTATPVSCPACGLQGPWSLTSDWRSLELVCDCGASWTEHGLSLVGVCLTGGVIEAFQTP